MTFSLRRASSAVALTAILGLSACAELGGHADPVIASPIGSEVNALATGAERRLVITTLVTDTSGRTARVVCAEPSPDAIEALTASVEASLAGTSRANDQVTLNQAKELSTAVGSLVKRSQGLQFFRDGIFALCQGSMNGLRHGASITEQYASLQKDAKELILAELRTSGWNSQPNITIQVPATPGN